MTPLFRLSSNSSFHGVLRELTTPEVYPIGALFAAPVSASWITAKKRAVDACSALHKVLLPKDGLHLRGVRRGDVVVRFDKSVFDGPRFFRLRLAAATAHENLE